MAGRRAGRGEAAVDVGEAFVEAEAAVIDPARELREAGVAGHRRGRRERQSKQHRRDGKDDGDEPIHHGAFTGFAGCGRVASGMGISLT